MATTREFRQVKFGRKLDEKRLLVTLSTTIRDIAKDPAPEAAPVRLESVLVEKGQTTVHLSGNSAGLEAVTGSLRKRYSKVKIAKSSRKHALRPARTLSSPSGS